MLKVDAGSVCSSDGCEPPVAVPPAPWAFMVDAVVSDRSFIFMVDLDITLTLFSGDGEITRGFESRKTS